jgi:hypothetical protein
VLRISLDCCISLPPFIRCEPGPSIPPTKSILSLSFRNERSGLLLLGLGDWYLHPRPQAVVPAVGPELLYNGLD